MRILAIDQGTTSTRALLHDGAGMRPVMQRAHRQIMPSPGHVERDPDELLASLDAALQTDADVIAIANQGESCLAWDARDGRAISPIIVWQDDRTASDTDRLQAEGAGAEIMARAGLPLDPYFSASKLGWILQNSGEAASLARQGRLRMGTTDAFFRDRLTGRFQTDVATASRTSLMNIETGEWDPELCRIFGVPLEALPEITPTAGDLGDLADGRRLIVSIVDQQAALFGHGCRKPGAGKVTFGTGAFVQCVTDGLIRPDQPGPLPTVAWHLPGEEIRYGLDGAVYTAAAAVDWAKSLGLFRDYADISSFDRPPAIDRGLAFIPALAGLACPHWDRSTRGSWAGLALEHGPDDLVQAVLEGVAMRTVEAINAIDALQTIDLLSVDGGLAQNDYLLSFLGGLVSQSVMRAGTLESTALGLVHMALTAEGRAIPKLPHHHSVARKPVTPLQVELRLRRFAQMREALQSL